MTTTRITVKKPQDPLRADIDRWKALLARKYVMEAQTAAEPSKRTHGLAMAAMQSFDEVMKMIGIGRVE